MRRDRRTLLEGGRGVYLVLTAPRVPHVVLARAAVDLGVPLLQLREKNVPDDELLRLARALREATSGTGTLFIVNDRPDVAAAVGADGVHVGSCDADARSCRRIVGPRAIVGVSARTPDEARAAEDAGADYIGAGPVFPTTTKPDAPRPIGIDGLARIAAVTVRPVVAIGGIDARNAADATRAGARFVAVISAVCHADDPVASLGALIAAAA